MPSLRQRELEHGRQVLQRVAQRGIAGGLGSHSKSCLFIACFGPAPVQYSHAGSPGPWLNQGVAAAPHGRHHWSGEMAKSVSMDGWGLSSPKELLQKLDIKGILLLPLPLSILPAALPQRDTWTSFCKHTCGPVGLKAMAELSGRAQGGPSLYSRMDLLPSPIPWEALATGSPWCSMARHTGLSFTSLILMWFHIELYQLHGGRVWLVRFHIPLAQCLACKCLPHARHCSKCSMCVNSGGPPSDPHGKWGLLLET